MRHGRHKQARRTLSFFEREVGLKPPYHVILDGTFIVGIIQTQFEASSRISKLLNNSEVRFHVHATTMSELQKLREAKSRAETFDQAIAWAQSNCEVLSSIENTKNGDASSPSANPNQRLMTLSDAARDLYDVVVTANGSNGTTAAAAATSAATKYLVATQDEDLLDALRTASVVPILRIARGSVLLLEQPSVYAKTRSRNEEKQKWTKKDTLMTSKEQQLVELVVRERQKQNTTKRPAADGPISNHVVQQQRKKTKAKGPNPLSCKKRKQTERQTPSKETKDDEENGRKRRRRRKNAKETSTDPSQNA